MILTLMYLVKTKSIIDICIQKLSLKRSQRSGKPLETSFYNTYNVQQFIVACRANIILALDLICLNRFCFFALHNNKHDFNCRSLPPSSVTTLPIYTCTSYPTESEILAPLHRLGGVPTTSLNWSTLFPRMNEYVPVNVSVCFVSFISDKVNTQEEHSQLVKAQSLLQIKPG